MNLKFQLTDMRPTENKKMCSSCLLHQRPDIQGGPKKRTPSFYFWDNFGNSAPILTILSLLQAEIYGA